MEFGERDSVLTDDHSGIVIVVKNKMYLESLQLLAHDLSKTRLSTVFFPVENPDLFKWFPEAHVQNYRLNGPRKPFHSTYGEAMLNIPRSRPDFVLTEHTENPLSLKSGALFGEHLSPDTPMTPTNSSLPVDSMMRYCRNGVLSFALAVEGENIQESIINLHDLIASETHGVLARHLDMAYMDGKRWTITQDQTLLARAGMKTRNTNQ